MTVFFVEHSWFEAEVYTRTKSGPPCTCHSHKARYSWSKVRTRIQELYNFQALTSVAAMLKLIILVVYVRAPLLAYGGHSCNCCCNCEFLPRILSRLKFRYC